MSRQDANAAFALTSFLYGGNAPISKTSTPATRPIPKSVDAEWRAFFQSLKDDAARRRRERARPVLEAAGLAAAERGELVAALDGDWAEAGKAIGDKVKAQGADERRRALRGRRPAGDARFDPRADADPRLSRPRPFPRQSRSARPGAAAATRRSSIRRSYGFTEADFDRPIFLDNVLGLEFATLREIIAILRRTYCQTLGVEFMHISDGAQKGWIQERIEGPDKEITFTREGKRAILNKLVEAEGFEKFCDLKFTGTKRFGLDGGESMIPALEQIIKRGGALGVQRDRASAWRIAAGSTCWRK